MATDKEYIWYALSCLTLSSPTKASRLWLCKHLCKRGCNYFLSNNVIGLPQRQYTLVDRTSFLRSWTTNVYILIMIIYVPFSLASSLKHTHNVYKVNNILLLHTGQHSSQPSSVRGTNTPLPPQFPHHNGTYHINKGCFPCSGCTCSRALLSRSKYADEAMKVGILNTFVIEFPKLTNILREFQEALFLASTQRT